MSETLGQQLKRARENKKLSLEDASEGTHIRLHYLQALEADDYSVMPSSAQARGFLRNYASFLGLDLDAVLAGIPRPQPNIPDDVSGPLPGVEVAPAPPEPVTRRRPQEPAPASGTTRLRSVISGWRSRFARQAKPVRGSDAAAGSLESPRDAGTSAGSEEESVPRDRKRPPGGDAGGTSEAKGNAQSPTPDQPAEDPSREDPPNPEAEGQETAVRQPGRRARFLSSLRVGKRPDQAPTEASSPEPVAELPPGPPTAPPAAVQSAPASNGESAEQILREIGTQLRTRRELLSLTPDEVERHIHVRTVFIEALESGDFDQLPSAVQTRGMLANYATFLDLDTDALLLRFADSLQASHRLRYPERPGRSRQPLLVRPNLPPLRGFVAGDVIFGLAVVVMVIALVVWGLGRVFTVQAEPVALPTAPSISDVLAGTDVPTPAQEVTLIPVDDTPLAAEQSTSTPEPTQELTSADTNVAVALAIVATERTFMRVMVDGEETFNGRVTPGTVYTYEGAASIEVLTGNGAALRVTYNGRDMGLLGNFGEVVDYIYTLDAVVTPIPAASPTGSPTLPISPTPTSTPTQTPTATGTASGG